MEDKKFLEAGKIVGTHGVRGELKVQYWGDSPDLLLGLKRIFICEQPFNIKSSRVHKNQVLMLLEGFESMNMAAGLRGQVIYASREDITLPENKFFIYDLIGLPVFDIDTGERLGKLKDVLEYPASRVFELDSNPPILIPDVPDFIKKVDLEKGVILVRRIEGM